MSNPTFFSGIDVYIPPGGSYGLGIPSEILHRRYFLEINYSAIGILLLDIMDALSTMLQLLGEELEEASWLIRA